MDGTHTVPSRSTSDRLAFEQGIEAVKPLLLALARTLTGNPNDAEDLCHDALVNAYRAWQSFTPGTNLKAWSCMVLRNEFYSKKRRSWRMTQLDQEAAERTIVDPSDDQEDVLGRKQELAEIAPIIGVLSIEHRDSLIAVHYVGMQYAEVANVMDCPIGTVKSRVHRAILTLHALRANKRTIAADLTPWQYAAQDVPTSHPYYPIAKAYERIYAHLNESNLLNRLNGTFVAEPDDFGLACLVRIKLLGEQRVRYWRRS